MGPIPIRVGAKGLSGSHETKQNHTIALHRNVHRQFHFLSHHPKNASAFPFVKISPFLLSLSVSLSLSLSVLLSSIGMAGEKPPLLKPFLLLLPLSLLFFILLHSRPSATSTSTSTSTTISFSTPAASSSPFIRIRRAFPSYDEYLKLQLNKTLDPRLRQLWATRDWDRKVLVFSQIFSRLQSRHLLSNSSSALCIGARLGQEVAALKKVGVVNSLGVDLVPSPPLVVKGDFHKQPFESNSFDFEFSNVFDHALYPDRFVGEIERTLKPGGVAVIHVALHRRGDKYSANDLLGVDGVVGLFRQSDLVSTEKVDAFGLDTEVVLKKRS